MKKILFLLSIISVIYACQKSSETKVETENVIKYDTPLTFDVSNLKIDAPREIPNMKGKSPKGDEIKVNSQYLTFNGSPWLPSYGEFHYQRYPAEHWEDALLKMKSQGFDGVSSYVFWIMHEEIEGEWNFTGNNNLRRFIKLCQKHGLKFYARIGPWCNGESRNGGHPDWLVERLGNPKNPFAQSGRGGKLRTMDPQYLSAVDKLYEKLAEQMKGLYWKDGGPIYAIQLDNEYSGHVSKGSPELIDWFKETAVKYKMDVPMYSITGWAHAPYTQDNVIPSYGSYADYFWIPADKRLISEAYSFSIYRAKNDINTEIEDANERESEGVRTSYDSNPYITCETGIGMDMAYHRRTNINHLDNGALSLVELGSGANGVGYFMNVGGHNPKLQLTHSNKDIHQGGNDNPVYSRDFQAAISEFGKVGKTFHEYPAQLHFMKDFGKYLAPCKTIVPEELDELKGHTLEETNKLQRALRTDGEKGFLFVNNHIKLDTTYQFNNVQIKVKLKNETITLPKKPITIPVSSYFYWPLNLSLENGISLKYATAQPVLFLEESKTYVFFKNDDIPTEFVFNNSSIADIKGTNVDVSKSASTYKIDISKSGLNTYFDVIQEGNDKVRFLVLSQKQAKQLYRNNDNLYLSDAEVLLFDDVTNNIRIVSENTRNSIWMYPSSNIKNETVQKEGLFEKITVDFQKQEVPITFKETQNGKEIQFDFPNNGREKFFKIGRPVDTTWHKGTIVDFSFPDGIPQDLYDVRVAVVYKASGLRFFKNGEFKYDNYYNGNPWSLSAKHLLSNYTSDMKLELKFIPLQPKDKIYIDGVYWPDLNKTENVLNVNDLKVHPVYAKDLELK